MSIENFGSDPSLAAGNVPMDQRERLRQAMDEIIPISEMPDQAQATEMLQSTLLARAARLHEESTAPDALSFMSENVETSEFITERTRLNANEFATEDVLIDDQSAVGISAKYFNRFFKQLEEKTGSPEAGYVRAAIFAAHYGQAEYFDGYLGDPQARFRRLSPDIEGEGAVSVSELKGMAVCMERAAVAHNILKSYGVDSKYLLGFRNEMKPDGTTNREAHAILNLADADGQELVFDPTNPQLMLDESGKVINARPTIYPVRAEDGSPGVGVVSVFSKGKAGTQEISRVTQTFEAA